MQLPPVTGCPVFEKLCNKLIANRMGSIASVNIWKETIVYDELIINERQKKDELFVNIFTKESRMFERARDRCYCSRQVHEVM